MKKVILGLLALGFLQAVSAIDFASNGSVELEVVYSEKNKIPAFVTESLPKYINEFWGVKIASSKDNAKDSSLGKIVYSTAEDNFELAKKFGLEKNFSFKKEDAYAIYAKENNLFVLAKSFKGLKYANYEIQRSLKFKDGKISMDDLDVLREPFVPNRMAGIHQSWVTFFNNKKTFNRYHTVCWSGEELADYIDILDTYGYNGFEFMVSRTDEFWRGSFNITEKERFARVRTAANRMHEIGDTLSIIMGPTSTYELDDDFMNENYSGVHYKYVRNLCLNDDEEKEMARNIVRKIADGLGDVADRVFCFYADHGGCIRNGCSIDDPMKHHMFLRETFREKNPNIITGVNLWALGLAGTRTGTYGKNNTYGWPGYVNVNSILDTGILSKDVEIVQPITIGAAEARTIVAKGHNFGIWSWNRTGMETNPGIHITHHATEKYFKQLFRTDVAKKITWHSIENTDHRCINVASVYAYGQLLWFPNKSIDEILNEFYALTFGEENVERIAKAYNAIEQVRDSQPMRARGHEFAKNPDLYFEKLQASAENDVKIMNETVKSLNEVKLAKGFKSRIRLGITPEFMLEDLKDNLKHIQGFALIRQKANAIMQKSSAGEKVSDAEKKEVLDFANGIAKKYNWLVSWEKHEYPENILNFMVEKSWYERYIKQIEKL